jgi:hypothetical protein
MKYCFNERYFQSKKAVDDYIRNVKNQIIDETKNEEILPDNKWFHFLMNIVNVHNDKIEKIGNGIHSFYFIKDMYKNDQLRIKRNDLTTIDCSCMYSKITQKKEYQIINKNLNDALRHAINDQIFNYKNFQELPLKCNYCNDENNCEIDHIKPFHLIKSEFLSINKNKIPVEFYDDVENSCKRIFKQSDKDFENKWSQFHKEQATYQVLCKACNRKKSGKV